MSASGWQAGKKRPSLRIVTMTVTDSVDSTDNAIASGCDQSSASDSLSSHASSQAQEGMYSATLTSIKSWLPSPRQRQTVVLTEGSVEASPSFVPQRVRSLHVRTVSDHVHWDQAGLNHSHHGGSNYSLSVADESPQMPGGWRTGHTTRGGFMREAHSATTLPIIDDASEVEGECSRRETAPVIIRRSSSLSSECIGADTQGHRAEQATCTLAGSRTVGRRPASAATRTKPGTMEWMISPKGGKPGRLAAMVSKMLKKSRNPQADK